MCIAGPTVFFAVRAVSRKVENISKVASDNTFLQSVHKLIGAFKAAVRLQIGVSDHIGQQILGDLFIFNAGDKAVLKAVVAEHRLPNFFSIALADIHLTLEHTDGRIPCQGLQIKSTVINCVAAGDNNFLTSFALDFQTDNSRDIFTEIINVAVVAKLILGEGNRCDSAVVLGSF